MAPAGAESKGTGWELRIKTGDTISTTRLGAITPAALELAVQRMIQDIAKQSGEMHLLTYEAFMEGAGIATDEATPCASSVLLR